VADPPATAGGTDSVQLRSGSVLRGVGSVTGGSSDLPATAGGTASTPSMTHLLPQVLDSTRGPL